MKEDSLANKVYLEIRKGILSNQILAGKRLKETEWADRMEVNRISVREALTRLLGEGLVVSGKKGGYFVKSMSIRDVQEFFELREILELGALKLAFTKMTDKDLKRLEDVCVDFMTMVEKGYFDGACEADMKFHEILIGSADNKKLMQVYKISNIPLFHQKLGKAKMLLEDYEQTDREHWEVVKALKSGNLDHAKDSLLKHLARGAESIVDK